MTQDEIDRLKKKGKGPSREYLEKMADAEDACGGSISVGGMAADLGQPLPCPYCNAASAGSCNGMAIYCCGSDDKSRSASCQIAELGRENSNLRAEAARYRRALIGIRELIVHEPPIHWQHSAIRYLAIEGLKVPE